MRQFMELSPLLRDLFWNATSARALPGVVLSLGLAALLGFLLGEAYVLFGTSLSNRRLFARNFLLLTVTTTLVISIVKSSLALSLGLVGALSIVRFRAAIKEPEELAFLFLAIAVGLGLGAGQALLTLLAMLLILALIAVRSLIRTRPAAPNLFLTVTSSEPGKLSAGLILELLSTAGARASLRRFDETPEVLRTSFLVDFQDLGKLEAFRHRLLSLSPKVEIACVDDRGLGA
jgi:hypothetical protein